VAFSHRQYTIQLQLQVTIILDYVSTMTISRLPEAGSSKRSSGEKMDCNISQVKYKHIGKKTRDVTQGLDNETFLGDGLGGTRVNDLGGTADGTRAGTELLDVLNNIVSAGDLAEDNVLAVEPASLHGGDEELGAVAVYLN
jgi:hypothetical protein